MRNVVGVYANEAVLKGSGRSVHRLEEMILARQVDMRATSEDEFVDTRSSGRRCEFRHFPHLNASPIYCRCHLSIIVVESRVQDCGGVKSWAQWRLVGGQCVRAILVTRFSQGWCELWLGSHE